MKKTGFLRVAFMERHDSETAIELQAENKPDWEVPRGRATRWAAAGLMRPHLCYRARMEPVGKSPAAAPRPAAAGLMRPCFRYRARMGQVGKSPAAAPRPAAVGLMLPRFRYRARMGQVGKSPAAALRAGPRRA